MFKTFFMLIIYSFFGCAGLTRPMINDVSTDFENAPAIFESDKSFPEKNGSIIKLNYPYIQPRICRASPKEVESTILGVIKSNEFLTLMKVDYDQHQIYFIAKSKIMQFTDDITVRITPMDESSKIDIRSKSRFGIGDFGVNAERIKWLFEEINKKKDCDGIKK